MASGARVDLGAKPSSPSGLATTLSVEVSVSSMDSRRDLKVLLGVCGGRLTGCDSSQARDTSSTLMRRGSSSGTADGGDFWGSPLAAAASANSASSRKVAGTFPAPLPAVKGTPVSTSGRPVSSAPGRRSSGSEEAKGSPVRATPART